MIRQCAQLGNITIPACRSEAKTLAAFGQTQRSSSLRTMLGRFCLFGILFSCWLWPSFAQTNPTLRHYLYAVDRDSPIIFYVYDMDNGFGLVTQVNIPTTYTGDGTPRGVVVGHDGMVYISHGCYYSLSACSIHKAFLVKYDPVRNLMLWEQPYTFGIDSHAITPDEQRIYMPTGEASGSSLWEIIDANTGSVTGSLNSGQVGAHNTIVSNNGAHVYLGSTQGTYLVVADTSTNAIIQKIGPTLKNSVRPFTISSTETFAYITETNLLGFEVGDIATGKILYTVQIGGAFAAACTAHAGQPCSHGISLSPDDKEVYVTDIYNNYVHIYDVSGLPGSAPVKVADIPLTHGYATTGWLKHSRDGKYVFVGGSGDVIDTATHQIVAFVPALSLTDKFQEVDFQNGDYRTGTVYYTSVSRSGVGYGAAAPAGVSLSTTSLSFASQTVGTTSAAQSVTLANNNSAALSIGSITVTGTDSADFAQINTCGSSVSAGGSCSITVTFKPTATGSRTGSISIADNAAGSPQTVSLTGTGVTAAIPGVRLSPTSLTFGSQTVGTTSTAQVVTLTNTGSAALTISGITTSGDFAQTHTCSSSLSAGGNCSISVTFKPTATGTRAGTLSITDNASGSPQAVTLNGTGGVGIPAATNHYEYVFTPGLISVYDMDNGFQLSHTLSLSPTHTVGAVQIRGVVASPATGMLYVSYGPIAGTGGGLLKYDSNHNTVIWAQNLPFGIDSMSISPDGQRLYMPDGEGTPNGIWEVLDANTGATLGQINSGGTGPHNTITSLNGAHVYMGPRYSNNLVLGDASTLSVIRNIGPVSGGVRPFTINSEETYAFITTSAKVGFYVGDISTGKIFYWVCPPQFCWTSGAVNGISGVSHGISLSPDEKEIYLIDLPYNRVHVFDVTGLPNSAPIDVSDIPLNCKLSNEGWLQHSRDGRFVMVGNCGDVIETSTRKVIANMPALAGTRIYTELDFQNGVLSFSPLSRNQGGYGAATPTGVSLSTTALSFGSQVVGTASPVQSLTLTNNNSSALSISSIVVAGTNSSDFALNDTCGSSVSAGGSCTISVTFKPTATGSRTGSISIADNAAGSPQTVSLSGTGVTAATPGARLSATSLTFGSQTVGTTSTAQAVTLTNTGSAALTITGITTSGDFAQTHTCSSSLPAGGNCSISVTFKPTTTGTRTGSLSIADNASGSPQAVTLTGAGVTTTTPGTRLSATSLTFASQTVGTTSGAQVVTLTNTGSAALTITGITTSGDFAQTHTCSSSLPGGENCSISVTFKPTATGTRTGSLSIADNASGSPQAVALTGTGATGAN